jgi:hypothetical protein
MQIRIGLENENEGRSVAWALDHPGCFAYGRDGAEALLSVPRAVLAYADWVASHAPENWLKDLADFDVKLVEAFEVSFVDDYYEPAAQGNQVNAFFLNDWKPLTHLEVDRALQLINWSHADLLELAQSLSAEELDEKRPEERWSRRGILAHVATAKWWLLDRIDLAGIPRADLPKDVFERFALTQDRLQAVLPGLVGLDRVLGKSGEFWSPRKVIRRLAWHERDHYFHLLKLGL